MIPERNPEFSEVRHERMRAALRKEAETDGLTAPPSVELALVGALRRRNSWRVARKACALGTAAVAAGALLFLWQVRRPDPQPSVAFAPPRTAEVTAAPAGPAKQTPLARARVPRSRPRAPQERPTPVRPVETNEFIPVGAWEALEPIERGSIVRVRLPRSVLPGLGIPVSAERWNEAVPAEVLLGEDGSMRAVRFVNNYQ